MPDPARLPGDAPRALRRSDARAVLRRRRGDLALCDHDGADVVAEGHELQLRGRVLVERSSERACVLSHVEGLSARLAVDGTADLAASGHAVAYLDLVGRIEGPFCRLDHRTLALDLTVPEAKRGRLTRQFRFLARRSAAGLRELRANHRIVPAHPGADLTLADGFRVKAAVANFSRSGAALTTNAAVRARVDDRVVLGGTTARVVRTFDGGFAVQFMRLLPFETFDADFTF